MSTTKALPTDLEMLVGVVCILLVRNKAILVKSGAGSANCFAFSESDDWFVTNRNQYSEKVVFYHRAWLVIKILNRRQREAHSVEMKGCNQFRAPLLATWMRLKPVCFVATFFPYPAF